jgi:tRNA A37 N6-isopentenylltransferase MiaA
MTWFRRFKDVTWFDVETADASDIYKTLSKTLKA